eukprot:scaffold2404_cov398-Prasinococcus_capsulatus_cf.AAC.29
MAALQELYETLGSAVTSGGPRTARRAGRIVALVLVVANLTIFAANVRWLLSDTPEGQLHQAPFPAKYASESNQPGAFAPPHRLDATDPEVMLPRQARPEQGRLERKGQMSFRGEPHVPALTEGSSLLDNPELASLRPLPEEFRTLYSRPTPKKYSLQLPLIVTYLFGPVLAHLRYLVGSIHRWHPEADICIYVVRWTQNATRTGMPSRRLND